MAAVASARRKPKRRLPPEILTDTEVLAVMRACGESDTGVRNQALIAIMYRSGLRVAEALDLYLKDVDAAAGTVRVLCGKGGRSRTVGIDAGGVAVLARWVAVRAALGMTDRAPLLCTRDGKPMGTGYLRRLFSNLAAKAGVAKRVHAHGFRHTHAAQLRSEGVDIGIISKQLGHRSITTTACYLDHICPMAVVEAIRGRDWSRPGVLFASRKH
jgi:integrase/recombinase XerC